MCRLKNRKAQSTLEYIIIFTAIVGGILFAANQYIKPAIQGTLNSVSNQMQEAVNHINFK